MTDPACDLCTKEADYLLCQFHLDLFRLPDVFSTKDGEYPENGVTVIWDNGDETFIGWYDHDKKTWFANDGDMLPVEPQENDVYWYYTFDLQSAYRYLHTPTRKT